jgi:hypothetical protein
MVVLYTKVMLTTDTMTCIVQFLDYRSIARVSSVSKLCNRVCENPSMWSRMLDARVGRHIATSNPKLLYARALHSGRPRVDSIVMPAHLDRNDVTKVAATDGCSYMALITLEDDCLVANESHVGCIGKARDALITVNADRVDVVKMHGLKLALVTLNKELDITSESTIARDGRELLSLEYCKTRLILVYITNKQHVVEVDLTRSKRKTVKRNVLGCYISHCYPRYCTISRNCVWKWFNVDDQTVCIVDHPEEYMQRGPHYYDTGVDDVVATRDGDVVLLCKGQLIRVGASYSDVIANDVLWMRSSASCGNIAYITAP